MIGWAAATGSVTLAPVLMVALIFLWTPPHFWSLALFIRSDYDAAGVPMLTVTHGRRFTRGQILAYALVLVPVSLGLGLTAIGGPLYMAVAAVLDLGFVAGALRLWRRDEEVAEADRYRRRKALLRLLAVVSVPAFRRAAGAGLAGHAGWSALWGMMG